MKLIKIIIIGQFFICQAVKSLFHLALGLIKVHVYRRHHPTRRWGAQIRSTQLSSECQVPSSSNHD